ncbi:hypothetical protein BBO99_00002174 [Phytophthora kernoviae]|uniref:Bacterial Pleckstrin homology domain-containing protein n=2 Tax=Phytophthora kernoviae TaxID=325452 RepID=A0A3R7IE56_9STRA|nr:hypothetical protein G195_010276 [Phytophthora kernoviae 00238/432]KAG2512885.1 hypothetical protein JM18_008528 [Phytophthora kernoviae]KAG2530829.1 hypothetical protein JM16_001132 [Phytophthora kernoviae]RLM95679.1 hypothetical protein BBI17_002081 [Phytophthora kernoviae]RLN83413.1 hypothetical protein BBO99_00002174 [Phytophthora kernoviae]
MLDVFSTKQFTGQWARLNENERMEDVEDPQSSAMGNTNTTIKGLAADIAGTTDICKVVADLSDTWAASYLLPEEEILYSLQSVRQEFSFTNRALIKVTAETSTTTKKLVERLEYKNHRIEDVRFQSTGVVDRDCELKLKVGSESFSIDITRDQEVEVKGFYKALVLLGHQQEENEQQWELARQAVSTAADTVKISGTGRESLNQQSDDTLAWMQAQYTRTHPHSYKEIVVSTLDAARAEREKERGVN